MHLDAAKIAKYRSHGDASYAFVPMSIKTYGHLGSTVKDLIWRHVVKLRSVVVHHPLCFRGFPGTQCAPVSVELCVAL